jgi:hypothetical protein
MRGRARCRPHLDAELGPRGAGAPSGNLNALRHGAVARPLPAPDFERLLAAVVERPDDLPLQVALALRSIQARTGDLFLSLVALRALLAHLIDRVAGRLFSGELQAALRSLSPPARDCLQAAIALCAARLRPEERLLLLRKIAVRPEQLPEPGPR